MEEIKNKFKKCMIIMYPKGVNNELQHRDLVRVFIMAWMEALILFNPNEARKTLPQYAPITAEDWLPDESWKWW